MRGLYAASAAVATLTIFAGCIVRPGHGGRAEAPTPTTSGPLHKYHAVPRFDLHVEVDGSLRPGQPIFLTLHGRAHFASQDVELRLILPEVAAAENSSWDEVVLPELGDSLPPQLRQRRPLAAGEEFREGVTVTVPVPGYYAVLASVILRSDEWVLNSECATAGEHKMIWLWIDGGGGRITEEWDPSLFPPHVRPQPGPFRSKREPSPAPRP